MNQDMFLVEIQMKPDFLGIEWRCTLFDVVGKPLFYVLFNVEYRTLLGPPLWSNEIHNEN